MFTSTLFAPLGKGARGAGVVLASLLMAAGSAQARDYYMAPNGSGNGDIGSPFGQLYQFDDVAQPGDTLYLRGGTYTNLSGVTLKRSGSQQGGYVTYRNYPGELPILDGGNVSGGSSGRQSCCFYSYGGNQPTSYGLDGRTIAYLRIQGLVFRNWTQSAISLGSGTEGNPNTRVTNTDIRYNLIDQCGQNGIALFSSNNTLVQYNVVGRTGYNTNFESWSSNINIYNATGTNNVVDGNVCYEGIDISYHHTDGNGIILDRSSLFGLQGGMTASNNICFYNGGAGIAVTDSGNARMFNNTLWENGKEPTYNNGGTGYVSWNTDDNLTFRNNLVSQSFGQALRFDKSYPSSDFSNNDTGGISFADAYNANFKLNPGSAGLDTGNSSGAPSSSIGFDPKVIVNQSSNQPVSWYSFAPDFTYVQNKGGLENCFAPVSRPQGGGIDKGAYEASGSGGTSNSDSINSFTAPSSVSPGQTVTVSVNYSATTNRRLRVMLLNPSNNWSYHGGTNVDVPAGSGTNNVSVTVDSSTPTGSTYCWQAQILDTSNNFINGKQQDNVSVGSSGTPTSDTVNSFTAPSLVNPGQTVNVTLNYSATTSRRLRVMLLNPSNNWSYHGGTNVDVPAGTGTKTISVAVDGSTPLGSSYCWQGQILDTSNNFLNGKQIDNISVAWSGDPSDLTAN